MGKVSLSPGYHFLPNEQELLWYLQNKVRGDDDGAVTEIDIYGDKNPWELFDKDVKKDYYVFTKLKKKNMSGRRIDRKAGSGTWKERQTKDQDKNNVQWNRKDFLFELEKKNKTEPSNGHWIMHEYSLNADADKPNDYVICKIKNKNASQEDYGPDGIAGIERFLDQIRRLKQPAVKEQDVAVKSCSKRKLQIVEDGQEPLVKKNRRSDNNTHPVDETLQFSEHVHQQQPGMQASSDDSNTSVSLPWAMVQAKGRAQDSSCDNSITWFQVQTIGSGNGNFFSASSTVDPIAALVNDANFFSYPATVFPEEDQQQAQQLYQQGMSNDCDNFQYGNGEENLDLTATPVLAAEQPLVAESMEQPLGASLTSEDINYQQMLDDPPEEFYFSLQELLDDPLEF